MRPTADVAPWLDTVSEILPIPFRAPAPYTLGEAVAELGAYADVTDARKWSDPKNRTITRNRTSLRNEVEGQSPFMGPRLASLMAPEMEAISAARTTDQTVEAAARFAERWHEQDSIGAAFRDMCERARGGAISRDLRQLSAILASQIGPAARGHFSQLSAAADLLVNTIDDLNAVRVDPLPQLFTDDFRVMMAEDVLRRDRTGQIVVWLGYYRATVLDFRQEIGPITFLRADWALPDIESDRRNDFPERSELARIWDRVVWLDRFRDKALLPENTMVLVRVDLGHGRVAGAVETARRQVEALLSVAVEAGGVSWQSAESQAVLVDGTVSGTTGGVTVKREPPGDDSYGIRATAEILANAGDQLGASLSAGLLPDSLVEALTALREARMVDHRDVNFYRGRPVTPRVATALEDHAMELIASTIGVSSTDLASALEQREVLKSADRVVAGQLMAPFGRAPLNKDYAQMSALQDRLVDYTFGTASVNFGKTVEAREEIRAFTLPELERTDFEDAIAVCTDPARERALLAAIQRQVALMRARHRRVRNAVNHGLPLDPITLESTREYAENTSSYAMNMALTWFKTRQSGATLLDQEHAALDERFQRIASGRSLAEDDEADRDSV